jgi:ATP-dependent Clp protease protease subunit
MSGVGVLPALNPAQRNRTKVPMISKGYGLARLDDEDEKEEKGKDAAPAPQVDKYLFRSRTVLITGNVTQELARDVTARLLALAEADHEAPITVIVSSPGGHVESGDMIHDMIRFVPAPVNMLGTGWVASAGALIYVSVPRERRFCTPNTRFLLHQPSGGAGGMATDIEIQAREIIKMRDRLNRIFATATGQPIERIEKDTDRDYWMSAEEAIAYGLSGRIVSSADEVR